MRHLMEASGETVNMAIENDGYVVFVSQIESHQSIRAFHRPGARGPMHASSLGKAMMTSLTDAALSQRLHHVGMPRFTKYTIVDPDALLADLATARKRGWAIDEVENEPDVGCVAAAVRDHSGRPIAAISIAGPAPRVLRRLDELGASVAGTAAALSLRLGYVRGRQS